MQHLKLVIPCMSQSFLYKGNFREINFQQLMNFAETKLGRKLPEHYKLSYQSEQENIIIVDSDLKLDSIKRLNQQVIKLVLKELIVNEIIHENTTCFVCQQSPITNIRYKCLVCQNMDLCSKCIQHGQIHPLIMISKPDQEQYLNNIFHKSMNKMKNLLNCSISKSKTTVIALKDVIMKKKQELFNKEKDNGQQNQLEQSQQFVKDIKPKENEEMEILNKTLRLSEIFEGEPQKYENFVKKNKQLSFEELVEIASEKYA